MELESMLCQLPDDEAAALRLRISGHADEVIAQALGIEAAEVTQVLRRAGENLVHTAVGTANSSA